MLPEGVRYLSSWVDYEFRRCFQLMEAESESKLRRWTANWDDLVSFELVPVRTGEGAAKAMAPEPRA